MRMRRILIAATLAATGMGCGEEFFGNALRNFVVAPYRATDECVLQRRSEQWANDAWKQLCLEDETSHYSADFEDGFRSGFVDYITRGGNGNPPATAPIRYQEYGAKTVPGERNDRAKDWFDGFRLGAARAIQSGLRETVIIPLASPPINAVEDRPTLAENEAANPLGAPTALPPAEALPPPRPLP